MSGGSVARAAVPSEQRVFSLVLALVARPEGATKRELLASVHGYADRYRVGERSVALERQFERDKEQLRMLGIPVETIESPLEPGNTQLLRYRIAKTDMQMPSALRFSAPELTLLRLAALAWRDGSLSAEGRRAAMKLEALGAGLDAQHLGVAPRIGIPEPSAPAFQRAIESCSVVRFSYQLPDRDLPMPRRLAPLRLHRADHRWHLIARDLDRDADRVFLLSRVVGEVRAGPERFDPALRERAAGIVAELLARQRAQRAIVEVQPGSVAAARLLPRGAGSPGAGRGFAAAGESLRVVLTTLDFSALAGELAGFGADVSAVEPPSVRAAVVSTLAAVRAQHEGTGPAGAADEVHGRRSRRGPAAEFTTPDRVVLLLALIPYLREHGATPVQDLARTFRVDEAVLRRLVRFLGTAGVPGETLSYQHEDLFDIDWTALEEHDVVSLTSVVAVEDTPRFSAAELAALLAGLTALGPMLPQSEQAVLRSTMRKLGGAAPSAGTSLSLSLTADPEDPRLAELVAAQRAGRRVGFEYRDAGGAHTARTVEPLLLSHSAGAWYLRAFCLERAGERTFRVDRMSGLRVLPHPADRAPLDSASAAPPLGAAEHESVARIRIRERALPRIADFAPEPLGAVQDGWLTAEVLLAHPAAAVRLVQLAPGELVVQAPQSARLAVAAWADRALAQYDD